MGTESIDGRDKTSVGMLYDIPSVIAVGVGWVCDAGVDQAGGALSLLGTSSAFIVIIGGVLSPSCFRNLESELNEKNGR